MPVGQWPPFGTFWEVQNSLPCLSVPVPFPPDDPGLAVYALGDSGQFLVDATAGQLVPPVASPYGRRALTTADYASIIQAQAEELLTFIAQVQARQLSAQARQNATMSLLDLDPPPAPPGGDGGTDDFHGGTNYSPRSLGPDDLYLQIFWDSVSNSTAGLLIHPPSGVADTYDIFCTTNVAPALWTPTNVSAAWWNLLMRCPPGQTNILLTNLTAAPRQFFILGLTNDTDGGGISDAYEGLLGLKASDANDDYEPPLVGISAPDSVAMEQAPTNTASFLITRLGGHMSWPLTVALQVSGTAILSSNYTLSPPLTLTASNALVTIPAASNDVLITLTPIDDRTNNGTKTATLTLGTGSGWQVDSNHASGTAWILEGYSYTYTKVVDFNQRVLDGLEALSTTTNDDGHLAFKTNLPPQFPYINVACSDRGTVARINTTNGIITGEYRTAPMSLPFTGIDSPNGPSPSRTTVDQYGNVWVANRDDDLMISGTNYGSITRIGLVIGGTRYEKKLDGSYTNDLHGQYIKLGTTEYNTCMDRDGDGYIRTSSGLGDILPWNNGGGVDSEGGVSTAEDEAITEYTRVVCIGTRTIAVDRFNDVWVGGYFQPYTGHHGPQAHEKINGLTALPFPNSAFTPGAGGYGGVIDGLGNLWSSSGDYGVLRLVPPAVLPPTSADWQVSQVPDTSPYGIAVNPVHPYIWQTDAGSHVFRWSTNGMLLTDNDGNTIRYHHGDVKSQGLAVDANGQVWVAHGKDPVTYTVGHLDTNGQWLGNVELAPSGLWAEYFDNTNLAALPVLTSTESPVDFSSTNGWPQSPLLTNAFSVRWAGVVQPLVEGDHVFYVSAEAGAAYRLSLNGSVVIDNWSHPATNPGELAATNWLGTNIIYGLKLEYAHWTNDAQVTLSWMQPGMSQEVIASERFGPFPGPGRTASALSGGATGISVDAAGRIWAGCFDSDTAVRIDPNAGPIVLVTNIVAGVTNVVTNHVGLVDMMVDLGTGTAYQQPYNVEAHPYNYSDMTGFNVRVVNPSLQPLKGYWMAVHDSGNAGQLWNKVSWNADRLTNGCSIEVYVRAADERTDLGSAVFVQATNDVFFPSIRGRFIEVRLSMTRDDPSKQPVVYDLTLYGASSGFVGDYFLYDQFADERSDAVFEVGLAGADPMTYQWSIQYPWMTNMALVPGGTNSTLAITNVDSWVDLTQVSCLVSNGNGEALQLGPAYAVIVPSTVHIPATNYSSGQGPAERYPMLIHVFDQPTSLADVEVTVSGLSHSRSGDLQIPASQSFRQGGRADVQCRRCE